MFSTLYNKRELAEIHVARVLNLTLLSEYSLRAVFPVRHCLPDYLPLCRATFLIRSLVNMIILPMLREDLKRLFFKIRHYRAEGVLKIGFRTIEGKPATYSTFYVSL